MSGAYAERIHYGAHLPQSASAADAAQPMRIRCSFRCHGQRPWGSSGYSRSPECSIHAGDSRTTRTAPGLPGTYSPGSGVCPRPTRPDLRVWAPCPTVSPGLGVLPARISRSGRILHVNVARSGRPAPRPVDRWLPRAQTRSLRGPFGCQSPDMGAQTRTSQPFSAGPRNGRVVYQALCEAERHKDLNLPDVGAHIRRYTPVGVG